MLFKEIMTVYSENRTESIYTKCKVIDCIYNNLSALNELYKLHK
jgi:hypothetical protein